MVLSSEYHRRQATTLAQLAQTTHNLDTAKALLRMSLSTSCKPTKPCESRNQRTSQVSVAAEIPPNRRRYRVTGVVHLRPLRGPRSYSHHSQKEPRAILSSGLPPMKSIDGMIGMTGR
jgi:hypothetical protein